MRKLLSIVLLIGLFCVGSPAWADSEVYQTRTIHSPDGIGKFYMGREIAQVMGHQGAGWLERPGRDAEEQPQKLIADLNLKPTSVVADIGAGTGYFSFRIAPKVPQGKVFAVDVQPEMLNLLETQKTKKGISNVEPVLGSVKNPNLPENSVDVALMVDAYHEFEYPLEMMTELRRSIKFGGKVVLVEYRGENPFVLIKPLHKMALKQVRQEITNAGFTYVETKNNLSQQHVIVFEKRRLNGIDG